MHAWSWSYTIIASVSLVGAFLLVSAVLLRRSFRRWRRTPDSISTPLGYMSYEQAQKEWPWGLERARHRNYVDPRGES